MGCPGPIGHCLFACALVVAVVGQAIADAADDPPPLAAAGVLERDGRTDCSAVLIGRDLLLTAAHCVHGLRVAAEGGENVVLFRSGAYPGRASAERAASRLMPHPLFLAAGGFSGSSRSADIALVALEVPVPDDIARPLPIGAPATEGEGVVIASYPRGAGEQAVERTCLAVDADATLVRLDCPVVPGESGAPVVRLTADGTVLAGIVVASGEEKSGPYALVVQVDARLGQLFAVYGHGPP